MVETCREHHNQPKADPMKSVFATSDKEKFRIWRGTLGLSMETMRVDFKAKERILTEIKVKMTEEEPNMQALSNTVDRLRQELAMAEERLDGGLRACKVYKTEYNETEEELRFLTTKYKVAVVCKKLIGAWDDALKEDSNTKGCLPLTHITNDNAGRARLAGRFGIDLENPYNLSVRQTALMLYAFLTMGLKDSP